MGKCSEKDSNCYGRGNALRRRQPVVVGGSDLRLYLVVSMTQCMQEPTV